MAGLRPAGAGRRSVSIRISSFYTIRYGNDPRLAAEATECGAVATDRCTRGTPARCAGQLTSAPVVGSE